MIEVFLKFKSEDPSEPYGHIGISAEVIIELQSIGYCAEPGRQERQIRSVPGCYCRKKGAERICKQDFFYQTFYEIKYSGFNTRYGNGMIMKLFFDGAVPDYRSGDELREHRYIQPEVKDVTLCFCIAPVNIYYV